jgi:hypothetical protein
MTIEELQKLITDLANLEKGGPGSGHHGHAGRPGKVGGSLPEGDEKPYKFHAGTADPFAYQPKMDEYDIESVGNSLEDEYGSYARSQVNRTKSSWLIPDGRLIPVQEHFAILEHGPTDYENLLQYMQEGFVRVNYSRPGVRPVAALYLEFDERALTSQIKEYMSDLYWGAAYDLEGYIGEPVLFLDYISKDGARISSEKLDARDFQKLLGWKIDKELRKHMGPGPHPSGSPQSVHAGEAERQPRFPAHRLQEWYKPPKLDREIVGALDKVGPGDTWAIAEELGVDRFDHYNRVNDDWVRGADPEAKDNIRSILENFADVRTLSLYEWYSLQHTQTEAPPSFEDWLAKKQVIFRGGDPFQDVFSGWSTSKRTAERFGALSRLWIAPYETLGFSLSGEGEVYVDSEALTALEKHMGPGPHPSGSPQSVHGRTIRGLLRDYRDGNITREGLREELIHRELSERDTDLLINRWDELSHREFDNAYRMLQSDARDYVNHRWDQGEISAEDAQSLLEQLGEEAPEPEPEPPPAEEFLGVPEEYPEPEPYEPPQELLGQQRPDREPRKQGQRYRDHFDVMDAYNQEWIDRRNALWRLRNMGYSDDDIEELIPWQSQAEGIYRNFRYGNWGRDRLERELGKIGYNVDDAPILADREALIKRLYGDYRSRNIPQDEVFDLLSEAGATPERIMPYFSWTESEITEGLTGAVSRRALRETTEDIVGGTLAGTFTRTEAVREIADIRDVSQREARDIFDRIEERVQRSRIGEQYNAGDLDYEESLAGLRDLGLTNMEGESFLAHGEAGFARARLESLRRDFRAGDISADQIEIEMEALGVSEYQAQRIYRGSNFLESVKSRRIIREAHPEGGLIKYDDERPGAEQENILRAMYSQLDEWNTEEAFAKSNRTRRRHESASSMASSALSSLSSGRPGAVIVDAMGNLLGAIAYSLRDRNVGRILSIGNVGTLRSGEQLGTRLLMDALTYAFENNAGVTGSPLDSARSFYTRIGDMFGVSVRLPDGSWGLTAETVQQMMGGGQ